VTAEQLDAAVQEAEQAGLAHLDFLQRLLADQAGRRRQRSLERRIKDACFRELKPLATLTGTSTRPFSRMPDRKPGRLRLRPPPPQRGLRRSKRRGQKLPDSEHRPSRLCVGLFASTYSPAALLLEDLTAALADQTFTTGCAHYARFDLLIIDEFGFDRIERSLCPQAAGLWYKIIDARSQRASTALVDQHRLEAWADYLAMRPWPMALLDGWWTERRW